MKKFFSKKNLILMSIIIIVLVLSIMLFYITRDKRQYDINEIENQFSRFYSDIELVKKDKEELMMDLFSPINDGDEILYMSNFRLKDYDKENEDQTILLFINNLSKKELNEYYELINGFIHSYEDSTLFAKAILYKGKNYIYLIIGSNPRLMEKELNVLYK